MNGPPIGESRHDDVGSANADVGTSAPTARRDAAQVGGVIGAPLLLLLALSAKYAVVQTIGCHDPRTSLYVHAIALISLLGCGAAAWTAQHGSSPRLPHDRSDRDQTMRLIGFFMSGLCALVILAQWLPQFALRTCTF